MNKYYKIFGLQKSAHFEEVTKKYNELSKEFDPANQTDDLKKFFIGITELGDSLWYFLIIISVFLLSFD